MDGFYVAVRKQPLSSIVFGNTAGGTFYKQGVSSFDDLCHSVISSMIPLSGVSRVIVHTLHPPGGDFFFSGHAIWFLFDVVALLSYGVVTAGTSFR